MSNKAKIFLLLAFWVVVPVFLVGTNELISAVKNANNIDDILRLSLILLVIPIFSWMSTLVFVYMPIKKIFFIMKKLVIYMALFILLASPFSSRFSLFDVFSVKSYVEILLNIMFPFLSFIGSELIDGTGFVMIFDLIIKLANISLTILQVSFLFYMFAQIRIARTEGLSISDVNFSESADRAWEIFSKPYEYVATAKAQFLAYIRDDEDLSLSNIGAQDTPFRQQSPHNDSEPENDRDQEEPEPQLSEIECLRLLGLEDSATPLEIKIAYRAVIATAHPDRNPDDPDASRKAAEINAAYDALQQAGRV